MYAKYLTDNQAGTTQSIINYSNTRLDAARGVHNNLIAIRKGFVFEFDLNAAIVLHEFNVQIFVLLNAYM